MLFSTSLRPSTKLDDRLHGPSQLTMAKGKETKAKDTKTTSDKQSDPKKGGSSKSSSSKKDTTSSSDLKPAQTLSIRHILCEKHSRKEEAVAALNAGRSFDDVAREFSEDKARQGGNLGWKGRGSLIKEFEEAAWACPISKTGSPDWREVKTGEGYHVLMVEGRK